MKPFSYDPYSETSDEAARRLFKEGNQRLLTPHEMDLVIDAGYMNPREGSYQDSSRWNEWHAFIALQNLFQLRVVAENVRYPRRIGPG